MSKTTSLSALIARHGAEAQITIANDRCPYKDGDIIYGPITSTPTWRVDYKVSSDEKKKGAKRAEVAYTHARVQVGVCCGSTPNGVMVKVLRKDGTPAVLPRVWRYEDCSSDRPEYLKWTNPYRYLVGKDDRMISGAETKLPSINKE